MSGVWTVKVTPLLTYLISMLCGNRWSQIKVNSLGNCGITGPVYCVPCFFIQWHVERAATLSRSEH
jgi:hypothetical protein